MFSDDTFCWEDFPASGSCPELSTARADAKSNVTWFTFGSGLWAWADVWVSEGFSAYRKKLVVGCLWALRLPLVPDPCCWLGLDPASCVAQGIRCWTCWYQTGWVTNCVHVMIVQKLEWWKWTVAEIETAGRLACQFSSLVSVKKSDSVNSQLLNNKSGAQLDNYYSGGLEIQLQLLSVLKK